MSDLEIRTLLMDEKLKGYNKNIPPTTVDNQPVTVEIAFGIARLVDISERDQSLTLNGWIMAFWRDHRLAWNLSDYNVSTMYYTDSDIWIPDLWIENSLKDKQKIGNDDIFCAVSPQGGVPWSPGGLFITTCELDVTYFPFDSQTCTIVVSSWVLHADVINIKAMNGTITGYQYTFIADTSNSLWDVTDITTFEGNAYHLPAGAVYLQLSLQRCSVFYVINLILPLVCISSLICLVYALPVDQGDRISLAMSILLTFVVFLTLLNEYLPETSRQTSILTIYLTTLFLIGTLSVALAIFTLRLSTWEDSTDIPAWLKRRTVRKKHMRYGHRASCLGRKVTSCEEEVKTEERVVTDRHPGVDQVKTEKGVVTDRDPGVDQLKTEELVVTDMDPGVDQVKTDERVVTDRDPGVDQVKTEERVVTDRHPGVDQVKWSDVSRYIDRVLMFTFFIVIAITNSLYFVITFVGTGWPHKC